MSDLPMTPVWGIHESVIRYGTSQGVFVVSGDEAADAGENAVSDLDLFRLFLQYTVSFIYRSVCQQFLSLYKLKVRQPEKTQDLMIRSLLTFCFLYLRHSIL